MKNVRNLIRLIMMKDNFIDYVCYQEKEKMIKCFSSAY